MFRLIVVFTALLVSVTARAAGESPGPRGSEEGPYRRQVWLVPSPEPGTLMRATLLRPSGPGPFRLLVINHASTQSTEQRAKFPIPAPAAAEWFAQRGYAVLSPLRPGHGETGGRYLEDQRGCDTADYRGSGLATAESIKTAIEFMLKQPFVEKSGVVVVGQSAGGWGALALASRNPPGVAAVISFAAGRGGRIDNKPGANCAPERLVDAARRFGETARVPVLAIYAENDTFFAPALSKRLIDAYRLGGGRAEYRLLPAFENEGHFLFERPGGVSLWGPVVQDFLIRLR